MPLRKYTRAGVEKTPPIDLAVFSSSLFTKSIPYMSASSSISSRASKTDSHSKQSSSSKRNEYEI